MDKDVSIIYRNYSSNINKNLIIRIRNICRNNKRKFFLSNNYELAFKLDLDGVYLPSFNKSLKHLNYQIKKDFLIIGSAHNLLEIRIKEKQKISHIFISSIFKKEKNYLGFYKFNNLSKMTKKKVIALGGINNNNVRKINMLNISGFAAINYFNRLK